ncbi:MAG TPA: helix-turn-helix domain-containing protein [Acidimicrobiales bacterium]|nr:helix-turn-helix domain-containing protein [Acidimicrobiales bacterium]
MGVECYLVPKDLVLLGKRLRELRGERSSADVARRAGVSGAYLYACEQPTPNRKGEYVTPSVPYLRGIADALGAKRSELLELAGHDEDAAYDAMLEARAARASGATALGEEETVEKLEAALLGVVEELRRARGDGGSPQHRQPGAAS